MKLPLKPICTSKDIRKDGTSLIFIQYCFSAENRTALNTKIAIPPKNWDEKKLTIRQNLPECYGKATVLCGNHKSQRQAVSNNRKG